MRGPQQHGPYDAEQRETAAKMTRAMRCWLVLWGTHSRVYWAFPCFPAPQGTVLRAPGPREMLAKMERAELAARAQLTAPARPLGPPAPARLGQRA